MGKRFTDRSVAALAAPDLSGNQRLHLDPEGPRGFGVLCSGVTNVKKYVAQRSLGKGGPFRRITIDHTNIIGIEEARERAQVILAQLRQGIDPSKVVEKPLDHTLRSALDGFLGTRKNLRPASKDIYRRMVEAHLGDWLDLPLRSITDSMVEKRHPEIAKDLAGKRGKGQVSANSAMRTLRILWGWADGRQPNNRLHVCPVDILKRERNWFVEPRRTSHVTPAQLSTFYWAVCELDPLDRDYLIVLLWQGMRRGECAAMEWTHLDLDGYAFALPGTITKSGRPLDVPMSSTVHDVLVARRALGNSSRFVFPGRMKGTHIKGHKLPLIAERTGIDVSPHDLRRTFGLIATLAGVDGYQLKALLNHSTASDVTGVYVPFEVGDLREAIQKADARLRELCAVPALETANVTVLRQQVSQ
jgi:integrase